MTHISTVQDQGAASEQPRGGRIGVAFDWGFAVQLALTGIGGLAGWGIGPALPPAAALGSLGLAAGMFALGEGLRRGNGLAYRLQLVFNGVLPIAGLAALVPTVQAVQQGNFAPLYTLLLLLGVSSAEVWLLLQPGSRRWYGKVDPRVAMQRHSGGWLTGTIVWAIVGGVLQTLAASAR